MWFALVLASCQSLDPAGATRAEKTAALSAHLAEWTNPVLVNQFAGPRTVQIFAGLALEGKRVSSLATGLASLVTRDGYALTASHVLDAGPVSVLVLATPRPGRLTVTQAGVVFAPDHAPDQSVRVPASELRPVPVRLVKRFPGLDLSLVHLPVTPGACFALEDRPPPNGSTVFSYGSTLSGHSSAGKIRHVRTRPGSWKLITSVPLQQGDSGGPLMSPEGTLFAIISRGTSKPFSQELHSTIAIGVPAGSLRPLIAADRARTQAGAPPR